MMCPCAALCSILLHLFPFLMKLLSIHECCQKYLCGPAQGPLRPACPAPGPYGGSGTVPGAHRTTVGARGGWATGREPCAGPRSNTHFAGGGAWCLIVHEPNGHARHREGQPPFQKPAVRAIEACTARESSSRPKRSLTGHAPRNNGPATQNRAAHGQA